MKNADSNNRTARKVSDRVRSCILRNHLIEEGDSVILGLSGGPDSLCLFDVLCKLRGSLGFTLTTVHVNHKLRPGAAEEDQAFVESICRERNIPCRTFVVDCRGIAKERGLTEEEAGREARYSAFDEVAAGLVEKGAPADSIKVCVAQNQNDQAETILFRLLRGTGTDGLAGMAYTRMSREGRMIIRPLLDVPRTDIEEYCREEGLEPRYDITNDEPLYSRNRIRLELLPALAERYNPDIVGALSRTARVVGDDRNYLDRVTTEALYACRSESGSGYIALDRRQVRALHPAIRRRLYHRCFKELGLLQDVSFAHLTAADDLVMGPRSSGSTDFPDLYKLTVSYDIINLRAPENVSRPGGAVRSEAPRMPEAPGFTMRYVEPAPWMVQAVISGAGRAASGAGEPDMPGPGEPHHSSIAIFDADKMSRERDFVDPMEHIVLRTRRPGDYIRLAVGRKRIQDLLVDEKVPREHRDHLLMAAWGREILWIPATAFMRSRRSAAYPVTAATERVLLLEMPRFL